MGIMSRIFGAGADETPAEVESKIAEVNREEDVARRKLAEIAARRDALLISGDDKALDADDKATATAQRTLDRAALARQELADRLKSARARQRQAVIADLKAEQAKLVPELVGALEYAVAQNEKAQAFYDKALSLIGQEAQTLFPSVCFPLLRRPMIEPYRDYLDSLAGPKHRMATPGTVALAGKPKPVPPRKPIDHGDVRPISPDNPQPRPKRKARKPLPENVPAGKVRCIVMRNGYEADGEALVSGDMVDLPADIAHQAVRNGACEYATSNNPTI